MHFDANFRLVREASKQIVKDPGLWEGKGFFVESNEYERYLESMKGNQQQVIRSIFCFITMHFILQ